jgi:flagellin
MQGLSIANNLLANQVQYNLNKNQSTLQNTVQQLSSGLRINSAADDPSGLAIATNLQTQVDGFQQASQNVQDANNAAQVAEGALATETDILQRMRNLATEAASDVNSPSDRTNLQAEITQLITEVNRISQNTNFNGAPLLDGSHAGFQAAVSGTATITSNAVLSSLFGGSGGGSINPADFSAVGTGAFQTESVAGLVSGQKYKVTGTFKGTGTINGSERFNGVMLASAVHVGVTSVVFSKTVTAGATNNLYLGGADIGTIKSLNVTFTPIGGGSSGSTSNTNSLISSVGPATANAFATTAAGAAALDGTVEIQVVNNNGTAEADATFYDSATGATSTTSTTVSGGTITLDNVTVTLGSFSLSDAGQTAYVKVSQYVPQSAGTGAFTVQSGADEGDTVQIGVQATNAQTLRISNVNVTTQLGAEDTVGQLDNALNTLLGQRAQLGAVIVRLNEDANNDNVAAVNLKASESAIRDLNVGQATTDFTKLQVLVQVGTSVLSQSNANAQSVLGLFR